MQDLKMLFHCGFYDVPLNGLAVYNGEEVYFSEHISDLSGWVNEEDYNAEIKTAIDKLKMSGDDEIKTKNYCIYMMDDEIEVQCKLFYDLYRLPKDILSDYKSYMIEFSEAVGYNCWHDPQFYKPYVKKIIGTTVLKNVLI